MGHLVSARAFRLGISFEWMDVWFARDISSYIFILFTCFRLRYFFLSYLYAKRRDRSNIIYSHIEFVRKRRYIFLQVFFYDSQLADVFKNFGANLSKYFRNGLYSYFVVDNNLNSDSLGLLIDADRPNLSKGSGEVWVNNYLYFRNLLLVKFQNLTTKEIEVFSNHANNCYMLLFYGQLIKTLNCDFMSGLKLQKGLVHKLRRLSVISWLYGPNVVRKDFNVELFQAVVAGSTKSYDSFKMLCSHSFKQNQAYSFINRWFSFDTMGSISFNVEFLKVVVERFAVNGSSYRFVNRYNRLVTVNLLNLKKLIDAGFVRGFDDLSSKYKDFVGYVFFKMRRRP
jgi:hypothetical protein